MITRSPPISLKDEDDISASSKIDLTKHQKLSQEERSKAKVRVKTCQSLISIAYVRAVILWYELSTCHSFYSTNLAWGL